MYMCVSMWGSAPGGAVAVRGSEGLSAREAAEAEERWLYRSEPDETLERNVDDGQLQG